jgi:hypothetical protein
VGTGNLNFILGRHGFELFRSPQLEFDEIPRTVHAEIVLAIVALKDLVEVAEAYWAEIFEGLSFLWVTWPLVFPFDRSPLMLTDVDTVDEATDGNLPLY